ncbi:MAG: efflux RND transporter periplasmic adaptor subunit [Muribaculaceae bacterium]|nr:efflux RND transporter periplasmic adaptor subunit [Muribaculaceae bacterium]
MAAILTACGDKEQAETVADEELPMVQVDVAHKRSVDQTRTYTANVEADNVNNIAPAMSNRIERILVDVGDHVKRGQTLVTLDASTADQQRINLELSETEYNRAVELLNIGAGTQRAVDQLKAQLDAQRAQYQNTLTNTVLKSPITGVVTARNYDPGDMTGAQPVLTVGQTTPNVKVVINVNESDLAVVKHGMTVDVTFDAYDGEKFTGRITRVAPALDITTRTFPVEVTVANNDERIRPGMFARVGINLGARDNVVVPDRAVVKQTGSANKYVYTYSNGTVAYKKVELGQRLDDSFELLSGIEDGDTVVIAGQVRLADGVAVSVMNNDK